jgi:hypothetical protein
MGVKARTGRVSAVFYMERPGVPKCPLRGSRPVIVPSCPGPLLWQPASPARRRQCRLPLRAREGRSSGVQGTGRCCIGGGDGRGSWHFVLQQQQLEYCCGSLLGLWKRVHACSVWILLLLFCFLHFCVVVVAFSGDYRVSSLQ